METGYCLVCGGKIKYYLEKQEKVCMLCGESFLTNTWCENGHFICDRCHSGKALEKMIRQCIEEPSKNPILILDKLMKNPAVHMHGPEHHVLTGAALLTAYQNCIADPAFHLEKELKEVILRASAIPGGSCGFLGLCGAAAGAGAFISIVTRTTPSSTDAWRKCGQASSYIISRIAEPGGPGCCKRSSYLAVLGAVEYMEQNFGVNLETPDVIVCEFHPYNRGCIMEKCPFFKRKQGKTGGSEYEDDR